MDVGNNIKKQRLEKGYTQKQLADKLYVTAQAVSRWEKGEIEPNLDILHKMSEIFSCKIDDLIYGSNEIVCERCGKTIARDDPAHRAKKKSPSGEESIITVCDDCYQELLGKQQSKEPVKQDSATPGIVINKTVIVQNSSGHVCERCKKDIPEGDLEIDHVRIRHARSTEYRDDYYHKECLELTKKDRAEAEAKKRKEKRSHNKKKTFAWSLTIGSIVLALALVIFFVGYPKLHPGYSIGLSIVFSYAGFATTYCLFSACYICDVFSTVASWTIHFPGLIFTWDLEGFKWLIMMKLLFFVLGILFSIAVFLLALFLSVFLSIFSFPFILIHNIRTDYQNTF